MHCRSPSMAVRGDVPWALGKCWIYQTAVAPFVKKINNVRTILRPWKLEKNDNTFCIFTHRTSVTDGRTNRQTELPEYLPCEYAVRHMVKRSKQVRECRLQSSGWLYCLLYFSINTGLQIQSESKQFDYQINTIRHFGDESFQAIDCACTDNQKQ